jgi:predicted Zn-dependent protease
MYCCPTRSFPGGYIIVFSGLLTLLSRDADLLAMVLGHEVIDGA